MSGFGSQSRFGGRRPQREVLDVPEPRAEDKSLDKLLAVRRQRLDRYERQRIEARTAWRETRFRLGEAKEVWRSQRDETNAFWQQARDAYFKMASTSHDFRKDKAVYERMKKQTAERRLSCIEHVEQCKQARTDYFAARDRARQANREQEKLTLLRDEIRASTQQKET